jgi:hypothetical protein
MAKHRITDAKLVCLPEIDPSTDAIFDFDMNDCEVPLLTGSFGDQLAAHVVVIPELVDPQKSAESIEEACLAKLKADYEGVLEFVEGMSLKTEAECYRLAVKKELDLRHLGGEAWYSYVSLPSSMKKDYFKVIGKKKFVDNGSWDYLERLYKLSWQEIVSRLAEKNSAKPEKTNLEMVSEMQGGGQLFGIDENGKLLFKDRCKGGEPVMFGFDEKRELITVYDRGPEGMSKLKKYVYAKPLQIQDAVKMAGYELFPFTDSNSVEKGIIGAAGLGRIFVMGGSEDGRLEDRHSLLAYTDKECGAFVSFTAYEGKISVCLRLLVNVTGHNVGAVRLLRI